MIPKKLHYCWFGRGEKPESFHRYLATWKKYCPDYEIVEWNEDNFDITQSRFTQQAYEAKKFAFVSDYARLTALYQQGGIYLDTDVEVVKNLDDLLSCQCFMGFEGSDFVGTSVIGSRKSNPILKEWLDEFYGGDFVLRDGSYDTITNVARITEHLHRKGLSLDGGRQEVAGVTIFPADYFSPKDMVTRRIKKTRHTFSIHHFDGSWFTGWQKVKMYVLFLAGERGSRIIFTVKSKLRGSR